jgi:fluoride exporter
MDDHRPPPNAAHRLPADSDIDLHVERQRSELLRAPWAILGAISVGGALGTLARYGLGVAFPVAASGFPWTTLVINCVGSLLIGVLMVLVTEVFDTHPLVRPFVGVGILGGFTTFSTYAVDIQRLVDNRAAGTALVYLASTLLAAIAAAWFGLAVTRRVVGRREATVDAESLPRMVEDLRR